MAGGYGAGTGPEKLYYPMGVYVDNSGTIYIADCSNHRIQMWYPGKDNRQSTTLVIERNQLTYI